MSVKVPAFTTEYPDLWFASLESQFLLAGMTCKVTMFYHMVANLPVQVLQQARHIALRQTVVATDYDDLKSHLIRCFAGSDEDRYVKFLELEPRLLKPSEFYRSLSHLATGLGFTDGFVFNRWAAKLPLSIRPVVMAMHHSPATKLETILLTADSIHSSVQSTSPVAYEVARKPQLPAGLKKKKPVSKRKLKPANDTSLCFYHSKFGDQAQRCRPPCSKNATR